MKSIALSELANKWPEAEAALAIEPEVVITGNSGPIAKLVAIPATASSTEARPRFDFDAHRERLRKRATPGLADALQRALEEDRNGE